MNRSPSIIVSDAFPAIRLPNSAFPLANHLLRQRFRLVKIAGIDLYVHWTFALVIAYVAYQTRGEGSVMIVFALLHLLGMFTCVTLHEYGHALAARRYGIPTADITLLPIGGLARLGKMPRIPIQEFVVALAGPAVNVVIALVLLLLMWVIRSGGLFYPGSQWELLNALTTPSATGFLSVMIFVNIALVLFNLIPAFPMDGGRVLRSILAMMMDYRRATFLASRLGVVLAILMAWTALSSETVSLIPVGIAVFIGIAGLSEARQVEMVESVRGVRAKDAVIRVQNPLRMDDQVATIAERWRAESAPVLPVVSVDGIVVGTLAMTDFVRALDAGLDPQTTAGQMVDHRGDEVVLDENEPLEEAVVGLGSANRWLPVVDADRRLTGMLHLDTVLLRRRFDRVATTPDRLPVTPARVAPSVIDASG